MLTFTGKEVYFSTFIILLLIYIRSTTNIVFIHELDIQNRKGTRDFNIDNRKYARSHAFTV